MFVALKSSRALTRPSQHNRWAEKEPVWRNVWVVRIKDGVDLMQGSDQLVMVHFSTQYSEGKLYGHGESGAWNATRLSVAFLAIVMNEVVSPNVDQ